MAAIERGFQTYFWGHAFRPPCVQQESRRRVVDTHPMLARVTGRSKKLHYPENKKKPRKQKKLVLVSK